MHDILSTPEKENLYSDGSILKRNRRLSLTNEDTIIEPLNSDSGDFSEFTKEINKEFSLQTPIEVTKFPTFTINDFYVVSTTEILFLLYKNSSILHYYKASDSDFKLETIISEDSLQTLIVDINKNIAIVGGGLFELRVFIYDLENFAIVTILNANSPVLNLAISLSKSFLVTTTFESNVIKWNLLEYGKFEILSNEPYHFVSISSEQS